MNIVGASAYYNTDGITHLKDWCYGNDSARAKAICGQPDVIPTPVVVPVEPFVPIAPKPVPAMPVKKQPVCSLNFSQSGPYTYDGGCGWCDYTGDCKTHDYCSTCCTNNNDPKKYNGCRLQKSVAAKMDHKTQVIILMI